MVIVDTDIIIASIRGNDLAKQLLRKDAPAISISAVTQMELYIGATNKAKKEIVEKVLKEHEVVPISKSICEIALRLIKMHNTGQNSLYLSDALIAATCLHGRYPLITFNTKDFAIIKGLHLAK